MQRDQTSFAKFCAAYREQTGSQINIFAGERETFTDTQTGHCEEPEETVVS
jgi:hypothetical protein